MKRILTYFAVVMCCFFSYYVALKAISLGINKLQVHLVTKQVLNGKSSTIAADMYYRSDGKITTHFQQPAEYILQTNREGEYQIYDPKTNTIEQNQSESVST